MIRILLNGEPAEVPEGLTVQTLLDRIEIDARVVAVELNRVVVRRAQYASTPVEDGAEVEIVAFVGGGGDARGTPGTPGTTLASSPQPQA